MKLRSHSFIIYLALAFLALSAAIYYIHYLIFHDVHHIFIYLVGDLGFLPLEVLLVVLIIERLLASREKQERMQKMNMVVGAFFSEVGNYLLGSLITCFKNRAEISQHLNIAGDWSKKDFKQAADFACHLKAEVDMQKVDLGELKALLSRKRTFILTLLENPNLLEHDRFTDLLWAVTHVDEELEARSAVTALPDKDRDHIAGDIVRLYDRLTTEWLDYAEHLKANYPFLFSLILRTHPFQQHPSATIA
jgi:hypothetical protein